MSNTNEQNNELMALTDARLSRRNLLGIAGQGALGIALFSLLGGGAARAADLAGRTPLERMLPGARELGARTCASGSGKRNFLSLGDPVEKIPVYLAMPFWGDGQFSQPQNYLTIQAGRRLQINKTVQNADIDGDGQDELIGRTSEGILVNQFDTVTGQWRLMSTGPSLSDYGLGLDLLNIHYGWENPEYYQTIQTADINGDGRAELIARDPEGIKVWSYTPSATVARQGTWASLPSNLAWHDFTLAHPATTAWNQADCYTTIQCADIDGDGKDEILGRSADPAFYQTGSAGLQVYKYNGSGWDQMPSLTTMSDANGWNQPQQYSTIQCADIDGDGIAEVIGRDSTGLHVWKYYPNNGGWALGITQSDFSDGNGWNNAAYYSTIQCADVDGDGQAEIVARSANGIVVYHHNKTTGQLDLQSTFPDLADVHGWGSPEFYSTIQCADFNGDGKAELIARSVYGIIGYEYKGSAWTQMADGQHWADDPNFSPDGVAWSQPQYYQTIQSAKVKTSLGTRSILLGKAAINVQSWTYNGGWLQSTVQFPQYISDGVIGSDAYQRAISYQHIQSNLSDTDNTDIRSQYADLDSGGVTTWKDQLTDDNDNTIAMPSAVTNVTNWNTVRSQLKMELDMVNNVLTVQTNMHIWYNSLLALNTTTLNTVNGYIHADTTYQENTNGISIGQVLLSLFGTLLTAATGEFGSEAAVQLGLNIAASMAGAASSALGLIPTDDNGIPAGQSRDLTYAEFSQSLASWYKNVLFAYDWNVKATMVDYGLLLVNGQDDVKWDTSSADKALSASASAYELTLWKTMTPYVWFGGQALSFPKGYDGTDYGVTITIPPVVQYVTWINADPNNYNTYPDIKTLQYLFGTFGPTANEVIQGGAGWAGLASFWFGPPPPTQAVQALHKVTIQPSLGRDATTGVLELTLLIKNEGTAIETPIEVTGLQLGSGNPASGLPASILRLRAGQSHEQQFRFPAGVGAAGSTVVLRVSGKYNGGTFGGSYRMKLP